MTTAFIPYYLQDGSHSHLYSFEDFEDRNGNKAKLRVVEYLTKKNKPASAVIQIIWERM